MQASVESKLKSAAAKFWLAANIAVGKGNAFGLAGGAGGVDQRGQIVGLDGAGQGIEDGVALGAAGIGIAEQLS